MQYSEYYQAHVPCQYCWLITALLRSCDHVAFDRTCDVEHSIFEFFVPAGQEQEFVCLMKMFARRGEIKDFRKLPNRFKTNHQSR